MPRRGLRAGSIGTCVNRARQAEAADQREQLPAADVIRVFTWRTMCSGIHGVETRERGDSSKLLHDGSAPA